MDDMELEESVSVVGAKMLALLADMKDVPVEDSEDLKEDYERMERPGVMHQLAALYVQGFSYTQMAKQFGVRPAAVRNIIKREAFKGIVDSMGEEVMMACRSFLKTGAITATGVLLDSMASADEKVRLQAANSVLDRVGLKSANNVEIKAQVNQLAILSDEEIMAEIMKGYNAPPQKPSYAREVIEDVECYSRDATGSVEEEGV